MSILLSHTIQYPCHNDN